MKLFVWTIVAFSTLGQIKAEVPPWISPEGIPPLPYDVVNKMSGEIADWAIEEMVKKNIASQTNDYHDKFLSNLATCSVCVSKTGLHFKEYCKKSCKVILTWVAMLSQKTKACYDILKQLLDLTITQGVLLNPTHQQKFPDYCVTSDFVTIMSILLKVASTNS